jgi:hypothetical protein
LVVLVVGDGRFVEVVVGCELRGKGLRKLWEVLVFVAGIEVVVLGVVEAGLLVLNKFIPWLLGSVFVVPLVF